MPRTARVLYDEGIYHILNRGNNKQPIFYNNSDYLMFKDITKKYLSKYAIQIYNYALLPNHFHFLLIAIKARELQKFMQGICQIYTCYHHRKYNSVGYLFQNRYKSLLINEDAYLAECTSYIERNPVRAGLASSASEYLYSSYRFYANNSKDFLLTENPLYGNMGTTSLKRKKAFVEFVNKVNIYEEKIMDKKLQIACLGVPLLGPSPNRG